MLNLQQSISSNMQKIGKVCLRNQNEVSRKEKQKLEFLDKPEDMTKNEESDKNPKESEEIENSSSKIDIRNNQKKWFNYFQGLLYHNSNDVSNIFRKASQDVRHHLKKDISFHSIVFYKILFLAFFSFILIAPSTILILNLSLDNTIEQYFAITAFNYRKISTTMDITRRSVLLNEIFNGRIADNVNTILGIPSYSA